MMKRDAWNRCGKIKRTKKKLRASDARASYTRTRKQAKWATKKAVREKNIIEQHQDKPYFILELCKYRKKSRKPIPDLKKN